LPDLKEVVYLQPQKQRVFLKRLVCFKVLLKVVGFLKKRSKILSKKIWLIKKN
jgi:hypothetical protein